MGGGGEQRCGKVSKYTRYLTLGGAQEKTSVRWSWKKLTKPGTAPPTPPLPPLLTPLLSRMKGISPLFQVHFIQTGLLPSITMEQQRPRDTK